LFDEPMQPDQSKLAIKVGYQVGQGFVDTLHNLHARHKLRLEWLAAGGEDSPPAGLETRCFINSEV